MPLKFWSSDLNSESNCFLKSLRMFSSRMRSEGSRCSFAMMFFGGKGGRRFWGGTARLV